MNDKKIVTYEMVYNVYKSFQINVHEPNYFINVTINFIDGSSVTIDESKLPKGFTSYQVDEFFWIIHRVIREIMKFRDFERIYKNAGRELN